MLILLLFIFISLGLFLLCIYMYVVNYWLDVSDESYGYVMLCGVCKGEQAVGVYIMISCSKSLIQFIKVLFFFSSHHCNLYPFKHFTFIFSNFFFHLFIIGKTSKKISMTIDDIWYGTKKKKNRWYMIYHVCKMHIFNIFLLNNLTSF